MSGVHPKPLSSRRHERDAHVIGIDVGGSKVAAAVVSSLGEVVVKVSRPTAIADAGALLEQLAEAVADLRRATAVDIEAIGVGVPGIVDHARGVAVVAANLPWRETPITSFLSKRTGLAVSLANDADAAALAEGRFGCAMDVVSYAVITLGTGLGCGVVLGGQLLGHGARSGVELGHTIFNPDGASCCCGSRGCLETLVSGPALAAEFMRRSGTSATVVDLVRAALEGSTTALAVFDFAADHLAVAIHNLFKLLPLERAILSGGVANAGPLLQEPLQRALARIGGRRPVAAGAVVLSPLLAQTSALVGAAVAFQALRRG